MDNRSLIYKGQKKERSMRREGRPIEEIAKKILEEDACIICGKPAIGMGSFIPHGSTEVYFHGLCFDCITDRRTIPKIELAYMDAALC